MNNFFYSTTKNKSCNPIGRILTLNSFWIVALLSFLMPMAAQDTSGGPDAYGYTWRSSDDANGPTYQWQEIVGASGTVKISATDEFCTNAITIPGGFNYYGVNYSSVFIGDNGWVNFLAKQSSPYHPFIYEGSAPNTVVAPFGEDLNGARGKGIYYRNDAINNRFIIQYDSIPRFFNSGYHSFQVILDKSDSTVTFQYKKSDNWHYTDNISGLPVTGIENATGTTGININNSILKDLFAIKFYQPAPYIFYNPESLSFTNTWVGNTEKREITLLNSGKKDLVITSITMQNGQDFQIKGLPANFPATPLVIGEVNSGDLQKISVEFTPTQKETISDKLIILSNSKDQNSTLQIPISATSIEAIIEASSEQIDFGNVQIDYRSQKEVVLTIFNRGEAGLTIKENSALLNNQHFTIAKLPAQLPFTIPANSQQEITLRFQTSLVGEKTDTLFLYNSSTNKPLVKVALKGRGVASGILFTPTIALFDTTVQGQTKTKSVRISNPGEYPLSISSISLEQNRSYSLSGVTAPFSIAANGYKDVTISFAPIKTGVITDSIKILSNLPQISYLPISGISVLPVIEILPNYTDFGQVLLGESKESVIKISNKGVGTLLISQLSITNANNGFSLVGTVNFPLAITAGSFKEITVKFAPKALGFVYNSLAIVSNVGNINSQLIGKGVFPAIELTKSKLSYGNVQQNMTKSDSLFIKNNGSADLIISQLNFSNGSNFQISPLISLPLTIPPGSNYKLKVNFTPQTTTIINEQLTIVNNTLANPIVSLNGVGTLPGMIFEPALVEFDSTLENSSNTKYLGLSNSGNQDLKITSLSTKGTIFEVYLMDRRLVSSRNTNNLNFTIKPQESVQLKVVFTPNNNTFFEDSLVAYAEALGRTTLPLKGQGTRATYQLNKNLLSFGDVVINQNKKESVTILNSGNGKLVINSLTLNSELFKLVSPPSLPLTIYPNKELTLEVEFKPLSFGAVNGTMTILTNSNQGAATVDLTGFGKGGALSLSKVNMNFAEVAVGDSKLDSLYLKNYGNSDLTINQFTFAPISSALTISPAITLPTIIKAMDSLKVKVRFSPSAVMSYQSQLSVSSNSVNPNNNHLSISGSGVSPDIYLSPDNLQFSFVKKGETKRAGLEIFNNGSANLIISNLTLEGSSYFKLSSNYQLPFTIIPGAKSKIEVDYTPLAVGKHSGILNIANNTVSNVQVNLNGEGALGKIESSQNSIAFGSIGVNNKKSSIVYLKNSGTYELKINSVSVLNPVFTLVGQYTDKVIKVNDSLAVEVEFKPVTHQNYFDFLIVESEVGDLNIQLNGTGLQPFLELSTTQLTFTPTLVGDIKKETIRLNNSGNQVAVVSGLNSSLSVILYTGNMSLPLSIPAGSFVDLEVNFKPLLPTAYSAKLDLVHNGTNVLAVDLAGDGLGANLTTSTNTINFGEGVIGQTAQKLFTINNSGNVNLVVDSLYSTEALIYSVETNRAVVLPLTIPPSGSAQFEVSFTPKNITSYQAKIILKSNSYDQVKDQINLTGYGVSAEISLNPGNLSYGVVKKGSNFIKNFKVENIGSSDLVINDVNFRQKNGFTLSSLPTYPVTIKPGSFVDLAVSFTPNSVSLYKDTIDILTNLPQSVFVVVDGSGGEAILSLNKASIDFAKTTLLTNKKEKVYLINSGNYLASLNSYSFKKGQFTLELIEPANLGQRGLLNILPNDSVGFNISFTPTELKPYLDTLVVKATDFTGECVVNGLGVKALLTATPTVLNIGDSPLNSVKSGTIEIQNSGNTILDISSMELVNKKGFTIRNLSSLTFPLLLNPSEKISLEVDFLPTAVVSYSDKIKIVSNNFNQPITYLYLVGNGISNNLSVSPSLLNYGEISLGNLATKSFTITNQGSGALTINKLKNSLSAYSLLNPPLLPYGLNPGQSLTVSVRFMPNQAKEFLDSLKIETSVTNATVVLEGVGSYPQLSVNPTTISFDSTYINNSQIRQFVVKNSGTADLIIEQMSNKNSSFTYSLIGRTKGGLRSLYTIHPNDSIRFALTFTPKAVSSYLDTLKISSNGGTKNIILQGKGAKSDLVVTPQSIIFPNTPLTEQSMRKFVVKNIGSLPLTINGFTNSNELIYKLTTPTLPTTLNSTDSLEVEVVFQPLQLTEYNGTIKVLNSSGTEPLISLKGMGQSGAIKLSKSSVNFPKTTIFDLNKDSVSIKNIGNADLFINEINLEKAQHFTASNTITLPKKVAVGDSITVKLTFSPKVSSSADYLDKLQINTSVGAAFSQLSGRAVNAVMDLDPIELDFDTLTIANRDSLPCKIINKGEGRILIDKMEIMRDSIFTVLAGWPIVLNPKEQGEVTLTFNPVEMGVFADSLKLDFNGVVKYLKVMGKGVKFVSLEERIPLITELYQNYPNPFNNTTSIQYSLANDDFVEISIYNYLGELVDRPVKEFSKAGRYTINYQAAKLSSGLYFYHFKTSNFSKISKMVLVK